jgi:hypothetical protein
MQRDQPKPTQATATIWCGKPLIPVMLNGEVRVVRVGELDPMGLDEVEKFPASTSCGPASTSSIEPS